MEDKMEEDRKMFSEYDQQNNQDKEKNRRMAENERNKGNESVKSKDYKEALSFYTKSIKLDKTMK